MIAACCQDFVNKNFVLILFLFFLFLYIIVGLWLSYNNYFIFESNNIFFGSDTARVFNDLTQPVANHYRISVHPLMLILLQPVASIINILFHDINRTVIFLQSLIASSNVYLIYSILKFLTKNKNISQLFASLYGLSFSTLIFTALPETYIFSAFSQLLLLYYALNIRHKQKLSAINVLIIAILGIMTTGIILSNFITFVIITGWLLFCIHRKKMTLWFIDFIKIILLTCGLLLLFAWLQEQLFYQTPFFLTHLQSALMDPKSIEDFKYLNCNFDFIKLNETLVQLFSAPILAADFHIIFNSNELIPDFYINTECSWRNIITGISLYLVPLIILLKNCKHKKDTGLLVTIAFIILINFILLFFYGSNECFIYSQNYLYLIFIFAGIITAQNTNWKTEIFYKLFLQLELIINFIALKDISLTIYNFTLINSFRIRCILQALIITAALALFIFIVKTFFSSKKFLTAVVENKYFTWLNFYFTFILIYIVLNNISKIRVLNL